MITDFPTTASFRNPTLKNLESTEMNLDWESLSLDELIEILDRLGLGFYLTLKLLLSKLKPGQKRVLMKLVSNCEIGKKEKRSKTQRELNKVKSDPMTPRLIKHILILLFWRADKKNGVMMGDFSNLPKFDFKPAF